MSLETAAVGPLASRALSSTTAFLFPESFLSGLPFRATCMAGSEVRVHNMTRASNQPGSQAGKQAGKRGCNQKSWGMPYAPHFTLPTVIPGCVRRGLKVAM